jgi:DNA-binding transcriptional MerR regulator
MRVPVIPDKLYFQIGEVCRLLELEPHVLRFWEKEFPMLNPAKGANGRRMYRKKDVEMALAIRELLYTQGFTIPGARKLLGIPQERHQAIDQLRSIPAHRAIPDNAPSPRAHLSTPLLKELQSELRNILTILDRRC